MPSKSYKQARLMAAAAHDPAFAKRVGVPGKVAKEFVKADVKKGTLKKAMSKRAMRFAKGKPKGGLLA